MANQKREIGLKRAYDQPEESDGTRVLVDRLWPRGITKERAHIDVWLKEIAPSNELRQWFGHDPQKFAEFRHRYEEELTTKSGQEAMQQLRHIAQQGPVTLVFAAHDLEHSNAIILRDLLMQEL